MKSYSGISSSKPTCGSLEHCVACHTLHQHLEPSHSSNSVRSLLYLCSVSSIWKLISNPLFKISSSWIICMSGFYLKWTRRDFRWPNEFFWSIRTRGPRLPCLSNARAMLYQTELRAHVIIMWKICKFEQRQWKFHNPKNYKTIFGYFQVFHFFKNEKK